MQGHIRRQIQQQTLLSLQSQQHQQGTLCVSGEQHANHRLINYIDIKAKCRHLKNVSTESNKQISKQIRKKRFFVGILEVTGEKSRIRIRKSSVRIQGSGAGAGAGSVPKYHGSGTLLRSFL
jgi:hypothetical protein